MPGLLNIFDQLFGHRKLVGAAAQDHRSRSVVGEHPADVRRVADLHRGFLEIVGVAGVVQEKNRTALASSLVGG